MIWNFNLSHLGRQRSDKPGLSSPLLFRNGKIVDEGRQNLILTNVHLLGQTARQLLSELPNMLVKFHEDIRNSKGRSPKTAAVTERISISRHHGRSERGFVSSPTDTVHRLGKPSQQSARKTRCSIFVHR